MKSQQSCLPFDEFAIGFQDFGHYAGVCWKKSLSREAFNFIKAHA
jgi:hypothetical protein